MKLYSNVSIKNNTHNNRVFSKQNDAFFVEVDPLDKNNYSASAENIDVGSLIAVKIQSKASVVHRKGERLANNKRYSFFYVFSGEFSITTALGTTKLRKNNFMLLDNMQDRTIFVNHYVSFIIISANANELELYLPRPNEVVGQLLSYDGSTDLFFFGSLLKLWEQIKTGVLPQELTQALTNELLKNISNCYALCYRRTVSKKSRRIREAKEIVGKNLTNPELSVEMVASKMRITSRYLRSLFSSDKEKLSHYILRRRLEECANQLENPLYSYLSITSIAFNTGFNSTAYFSRAFKNHYKVTPREYRKHHLESSP